MSTDTTTETPAMARLRAAREAVAELEAASVPDTGDAPRLAQAGEWMHGVDPSGIIILRSASVFGAPSVNLLRGDEIEIDAAMLEADRDRFGNPSWAALLHDEAAQVERWGAVRIRAGRAPRDLERWVHGNSEWSEQREIARRAAWAETDPQRRADALAEVHRRFGAAPTTSTITATIRGDNDAEAQQQQIAAAAALGAPNVTGGTAS